MEEIAHLASSVNLIRPDCAFDKAAEQREQMMLDAAEYIKMARAQRKLCQDKVERAIQSVDKPHSEWTCTFVVDYGQNMELPVFNSQQAGATYYFSPMKVNNLGIVDQLTSTLMDR